MFDGVGGLGTLTFVDPVNSEIQEFFQIIFFLKLAFTVKRN